MIAAAKVANSECMSPRREWKVLATKTATPTDKQKSKVSSAKRPPRGKNALFKRQWLYPLSYTQQQRYVELVDTWTQTSPREDLYALISLRSIGRRTPPPPQRAAPRNSLRPNNVPLPSPPTSRDVSPLPTSNKDGNRTTNIPKEKR